MTFKASVKGVEQVRGKLRQLQDLREVQEVVRTHGAELQQNAMRKAPRDTGYLRRSISLDVASNGLDAKVYPTAEYAPYVEKGTRFMSPQPFLGPSANEQRLKFQSDLNRIMRGKTR